MKTFCSIVKNMVVCHRYARESCIAHSLSSFFGASKIRSTFRNWFVTIFHNRTLKVDKREVCRLYYFSNILRKDLRELLFDDYSRPITEEEKAAKPFAIPQYPDQELAKALHYKGYELTLSSGKQIKLDWADGNAEYAISKLPVNKQTRNSSLIARNLQLKVGENWEKVQRFHLFSVRDMAEIQKAASRMDPTTNLMVEIDNPTTGETQMYPIIAAPRFFFLTEA